MTVEQNNLPVTIDELLERAKGMLAAHEYNIVKSYVSKGGYQLSPDTSARFFELYLNGSNVQDIWKLNRAFPIEAIYIARVKYNWDLMRDQYVQSLSMVVRDKVVKATLETTSLLTDMLAAANKHHGDKIKKFLQTGDDKDLEGVISVKSIGDLLRMIDGLQKITGQDKVQRVKSESTQNVNLNVNTGASTKNNMTPEVAAKILQVLADARRGDDEKGQG